MRALALLSHGARLPVPGGGAFENLLHARQASVEGDLDQPAPDLLAAVVVICQVQSGVSEQVRPPE